MITNKEKATKQTFFLVDFFTNARCAITIVRKNGFALFFFVMDRFDYESPLGILGKLADIIVLKKYMTKLLIKRNDTIKEFAESDKWESVH